MVLLKTEEVSSKLGMSREALHSLRHRNASFPQPIRISQKVLRWDEADIDNWLTAKKESTNDESERDRRQVTA